MKNLGQTWIFYKLGQTHITQTKRDSVDLDDLDDPSWFQPCSTIHVYNYYISYYILWALILSNNKIC